MHGIYSSFRSLKQSQALPLPVDSDGSCGIQACRSPSPCSKDTDSIPGSPCALRPRDRIFTDALHTRIATGLSSRHSVSASDSSWVRMNFTLGSSGFSVGTNKSISVTKRHGTCQEKLERSCLVFPTRLTPWSRVRREKLIVS